jgi:hypothetical protein
MWSSRRMSSTSALIRLLERLLGTDTEAQLARVYSAPSLLAFDDDAAVPRAVVAHALNVVLLFRSMSEVPDLARYADEKLGGPDALPIVLDHGAVRSVRHVPTGALPPGQLAFSRFLIPLGYEEADVYPLPGLRMLGHGWRHQDFPEDVAQYFISELNVDAFSPSFQAAVQRVAETSTDPLSGASLASLDQLAERGSIALEGAANLVSNLTACFARQHAPPTLVDYELLLSESAEMAWIATEGHTFNHATDRVPDVDRVADAQRSLGRRIKATVEVSAAGTVRQTAFEAVTVWRPFRDAHGAVVQRPVPGSFFEMISRDAHPDGSGLDLRFDASNAQGIFAMTRGDTGPPVLP